MMMMKIIPQTKDTQKTGAVQPDFQKFAAEPQSAEMVIFTESEKVLLNGVDWHLQTPVCLDWMLTTSILQAPALFRNLMLGSSHGLEFAPH